MNAFIAMNRSLFALLRDYHSRDQIFFEKETVIKYLKNFLNQNSV